jgi:hypothetical protein
VVAIAMLVLTVLLLVPDRLSSEPASTSTTDVFGRVPAAPPSPLTRYPRRPGAKYEDIEARPTDPVELGIERLRLVTWSIEPHNALPGLSAPAKTFPYRALGLVDGYSPSTTSTDGDILRVVVHSKPTLLSSAPACVATVARDGTVLVPYDRPPPKPPRTTTSVLTTRPPVDIGLFFPLGARRGRIYITCRDAFNNALIADDARAVWGFDV